MQKERKKCLALNYKGDSSRVSFSIFPNHLSWLF